VCFAVKKPSSHTGKIFTTGTAQGAAMFPKEPRNSITYSLFDRFFVPFAPAWCVLQEKNHQAIPAKFLPQGPPKEPQCSQRSLGIPSRTRFPTASLCNLRRLGVLSGKNPLRTPNAAIKKQTLDNKQVIKQ